MLPAQCRSNKYLVILMRLLIPTSIYLGVRINILEYVFPYTILKMIDMDIYILVIIDIGKKLAKLKNILCK